MNQTLMFYINQLSPKRATIYSKSWWTVGCIIYKQTKGSEEGYNLWHSFSQRDTEKYSKCVCDKKWESYKKASYPISIRKLISFVNDDGGSIYNPNHSYFVESEEVRNFVYTIIIPKLSIRRMRNLFALKSICSAMYHMSSGKDRDAMLKVSERIKNENYKSIFVATWDYKKFTFCNKINDIIFWHNSDEKEKPNPRATNIQVFTRDNPLWLEQTTNYLKIYDNMGYTPRYFKVNAEERKKLKSAVARRKDINMAHNAGCFDIAELLLEKKCISKKI